MGNFLYFNYNKNDKIKYQSLMDKNYRRLPGKIGIFSTHSKSKKNLPYGSVFLLLLCFEKIPIFQVIGDNYDP